MDIVNQLLLSLAASPWVYGAVFVLVVIDGICAFPPSETLLVVLGATAASTGSPNAALLIAVAACGAFVGDNLAFSLGRTLGRSLDKGLGAGGYRWTRLPRVARAITSARSRLERRPASFILTARFIPFGRIVMNYTAGATGFSRRLFIRCSAVAGLCWSAYAVMLGMFAGALFRDDPFLAAGLGIVLAILIGFLADALVARQARAARIAAEREAVREAAREEERQTERQEALGTVREEECGAEWKSWSEAGHAAERPVEQVGARRG